MITVKDMFKYASEHQMKLLSEFPDDFWDEYLDNSEYYDKFFAREYRSFYYFLQEPDQTIAEVTQDFIEQVYTQLLVNRKKYAELARVYGLEDTENDFTNPYHVKVERDSTFIVDEDATLGSRSDSGSETLGQRDDSYSDTVGSRTDSGSETIGSRSDSGSNTIGTQSNSRELKTEGFNSNDYTDKDKNIESLGSRSDSSSSSIGQQDNSSSTTIGQQDNSGSSTIGQQDNSNSYTKGQQDNTLDRTDTLDLDETRKGNIGLKSATQLIAEHDRFWRGFDFYRAIFKDLQASLLLVESKPW